MDEKDIAVRFAEAIHQSEMTNTFALGVDENESLIDFLHTHNKECKYYDDGTSAQPPGGAIGGRLTYCFTPTTIGTGVEVQCACGVKKDLTNYDNW